MGSLLLNNSSRSHAIASAANGEITFSLSPSHGASRSQWFRAIFAHLSDSLGVSFREVDYGSGEINFKCSSISREEFLSIDGGEPSLIQIKSLSSIEWKSAKDTRQYGGVQDQLTVCRTVLRALGLSYPGGSPWNLDISQTIMSYNWTDAGLYGHTFFPTELDMNALISLYGSNSEKGTQFHQARHSDTEESLLVGKNGVKDYFYIIHKGINPSNKASITYDEIGPIYNDYNNHSIANFNAKEGDKIIINRRLFSPYDSNAPATAQWLQGKAQGLSISYAFSGVPSEEWRVRETESNLIYNDAGKIMVNVNAKEPGLGPEFGVNNYLIGFLDTSSGEEIAALDKSYFGVFDDSKIGGSDPDVLKGDTGSDLLIGGQGHDQLTGMRGADFLDGGSGNDILRAGNGRDVITGGSGKDVVYGGFGLNTFDDFCDGEIDQIYFKSDQLSYNWLYGKAGNSPNGQKADKITELDSFDRIYVQGVATSQLTFRAVSHQSNLGETLSGIGIYASGYLEAVYVGDNLSMSQIAAMTQGVAA